MANPDMLRFTKIPLTHGSGAIPAVGFGTLIRDPLVTKEATKTALEVGYRHFDCAERYRNEEAVGDAMQAALSAGAIRREDVFVSTKLWNTNHRPERVKPAFDASRRRLKIDTVDCYLIHTPFAFQPGDELDPRDEHGQVIYDSGVTLIETWQALERLVDDGRLQVDRRNRCYFGEAASRSLRPRGSSLQSCRSNCILISLNGTCSTSVASMGSSSKRAHRWDMTWRLELSTTR